MQIQPTQQLLPCVFRMSKTILWQWQPRSGNSPLIRIADQRQDRMIERRSRDLDPLFAGRRSMGRKNLGQQFTLPRDHEFLILKRVPMPLFDQSCDVRFIQEKYVEPCNLRKNLQVREILRLKIALRSFRRVARSAKTLPQLAVARVPPNHVDRIRLEQILQ